MESEGTKAVQQVPKFGTRALDASLWLANINLSWI